MEISCTSCGGAVPILEDDAFASCPFCGAALALEPGGAVPHLYMPVRVGEHELPLHLARSLAALEISAAPEIDRVALEYLPFWRVVRGVGRCRLRVAVEPPAEELLEIPQLVGETLPLAPALRERFRFVPPDLGLDDAPQGAALVHVPFYRVAYRIDGRPHEALVEAIDGGAFADAWPAPSGSWRSALIGGFVIFGFGAFFAEALLLPIGSTLAAFVVTAGLMYAASALWLRRKEG